MGQYKHGSFAKELPTALTSVVTTTANITFVVGTAPIHLVDETNVNRLCRLNNLAEAVAQFGDDDNFTDFSLSAAIYAFFRVYKVAPVYFVNVLDPSKHKTAAAPETGVQVNNQVVLSKSGALKTGLKVEVVAVEKLLGKDYTLEYNTDNKLVVKVPSGSTIKPADTLTITYSCVDPSKVTAKEIIGGIDKDDNYTGIELAQKMNPKFKELPGSLIAPGYSQDLTVTLALLATAKSINVKFRANAIVDLDTSKMTTYADAVETKSKAGLTDPQLNVCVGDLLVGDVKFKQSIFLAAVKQRLAADNDGVPNLSPSNKPYYITGYQINGKSPDLDESQAQYLNGNGIILALNTDNGWRCWGNRTACFPGITDVKDFDIAVRDCGNWLMNSCIKATQINIDEQLSRPVILRLTNKIQGWLDGLVGQGYLISGRFTIPKDKNPLTELALGNIVFVLEWCTGVTVSSVTTEFAFNVYDLNKVFG